MSPVSLEIPMGDEFAISRGFRPEPHRHRRGPEATAISRKRRERVLEDEAPVDEEPIPESLEEVSLHRVPTDFQISNVRRMARYKLAASFSVPGAGKTSEAILYWLSQKTPEERLLVVLPKVASIAWKEELFEWLRWGPSEIHVMSRPSDFL